MLEMKTSLLPSEWEFVKEYIDRVYLRAEIAIHFLERDEGRKYSKGEKRRMRMQISLNLARKNNIPPARHAELIDMVVRAFEQ